MWMFVCFSFSPEKFHRFFFVFLFFQIIDSSLYLNFCLKMIFGIHIFFLKGFHKSGAANLDEISLEFLRFLRWIDFFATRGVELWVLRW